jgi:hypothetical protein
MSAKKLFYLCSHMGCNKKYQTDRGYIKHVMGVHGEQEPVLPDAVELKSKSGHRTNTMLITQQQIEAAKKRKQEQADVESQILSRVATLSGDCCICMEEGMDGACVPCGHAFFHYHCLLQWVEYRNTCPFCRGHVAQVIKIYS